MDRLGSSLGEPGVSKARLSKVNPLIQRKRKHQGKLVITESAL